MKQLLVIASLLLAAFIVASGSKAVAATIASDSGGDAAYGTLPTDLDTNNGGFGFAPWSVTGLANGAAVAANVGGTDVFFVDDSNGSGIVASRNFNAELGVGETFSVINFAISVTPLIDATGIYLLDGGTIVADFFWGGNFGGDWFFNATGAGTSGAIGLTGASSQNSLQIDFTRTASNGFRLEFYDNGSIVSSATQTGSLSSGTTAIDGFAFHLAESGTRFTAQTVQVVPEPSTYAMLIAGGLAMGGAAMRRRRRMVRG